LINRFYDYIFANKKRIVNIKYSLDASAKAAKSDLKSDK